MGSEQSLRREGHSPMAPRESLHLSLWCLSGAMMAGAIVAER